MSTELNNILNITEELETDLDKDDYSANPNIKPVTEVRKTNRGMSFNDMMDEPVNSVKLPTGKKFIMKTTFIDSKTQRRDRVEITSSVCNICAFDIAEKNGFGAWRRVPTDSREALLSALEEHKRQVHFAADALIIDESQIPDRWLGNIF